MNITLCDDYQEAVDLADKWAAASHVAHVVGEVLPSPASISLPQDARHLLGSFVDAEHLYRVLTESELNELWDTGMITCEYIAQVPAGTP